MNVLVTGANRGLGYALCECYSSSDADITVILRNSSVATSFEKKFPKANILIADLSSEEDITGLLSKISFGLESSFDRVIHCAGLSEKTILDDVSDITRWSQIMFVNAIVPYLITNQLIKFGLINGGATIAMMSSIAGSSTLNLCGDSPAYSSSKAALNRLCRYLHDKEKKTGLRTLAIHPGWLRTRMGSDSADLSPDDCASVLYEIIENKDQFVGGMFVNYDGSELSW